MRYAKYTIFFPVRFLTQPLLCEGARIIMCAHYELPVKKMQVLMAIENVTTVKASANIEEVLTAGFVSTRIYIANLSIGGYF